MAGSYQHINHGWSLVENMGDAYETAEELFWLVRRAYTHEQAEQLLDNEYYPMKRGEKPKDAALLEVEEKMDA